MVSSTRSAARSKTKAERGGTVVVAAWENDLDRDKARRVLDGAEVVDVTAG
jgi:hypothetical protein